MRNTKSQEIVARLEESFSNLTEDYNYLIANEKLPGKLLLRFGTTNFAQQRLIFRYILGISKYNLDVSREISLRWKENE